MSDTTRQIPSQDPIDAARTHTARAEALSWLASRYRWEQLLADLHEIVERETGVAKLQSSPRDERNSTEQSSAA